MGLFLEITSKKHHIFKPKRDSIKTILSLATLLSISLYANENWIEIEPQKRTKTPQRSAVKEINISELAPLNSVLKRATIIKSLLETTAIEKKPNINDSKKWFPLNAE